MYGTDSTPCEGSFVMEQEIYYSLSYDSDSTYNAILEKYYVTLSEDRISRMNCINMVAGKKYKVQ